MTIMQIPQVVMKRMYQFPTQIESKSHPENQVSPQPFDMTTRIGPDLFWVLNRVMKYSPIDCVSNIPVEI